MYRRTLFVSALFAGSAIITGSAAAADIDVAPPLFDWSGFYIGAHVGGLFGDDRDGGCDAFKDIKGEKKDHGGMIEVLSVAVVPLPSDGDCFDAKIHDYDSLHDGKTVKAFNLDGDYVAITEEGGDDDDLRFLVGPQVGINQQYGMWVVGLEADFSWLGGDGDGQDIGFEYFHKLYSNDVYKLEKYEGAGKVEGGELDWIATFRGRLGAAVGSEGRGLIYATGGLALAGVEGLSGSFDDEGGKGWCDGGCSFDDDTDDDIRVGFAVGAGGEWAWTETVSIGAEYLFLGFGDDGETLTFHGDDGRQFSFENDLDDLHAFRIKLNYRFPPG